MISLLQQSNAMIRRQMPNLGYLAVHALYHLGLAIWIGGAIVLGALVAPRLFRSLPRSQAGALFGPTLRAFSRVRAVALAVIIIAAALQHLVWERGNVTPWIGLRWLALGVMGSCIVYEIGLLEPRLTQKGAQLTEDIGERSTQGGVPATSQDGGDTHEDRCFRRFCRSPDELAVISTTIRAVPHGK
jgi:hypothetical protein